MNTQTTRGGSEQGNPDHGGADTRGSETLRPVVRRVRVLNPPGLHARPASVLAAAAKRFESDIELVLIGGGVGTTAIDTGVDAKSILDVIVLGAGHGAEIDVRAVGPDAEEAVTAIEVLFANKFGVE